MRFFLPFLGYILVLGFCPAQEKGVSTSSSKAFQVTDPSASLELEEDWLHQAEGKPLAKRTIQEIQWTREIVDRMRKLPGAPDLRAELTKLAELEALTLGKPAIVPATPSTAVQAGVKLPDGLVGRWMGRDLAEDNYLKIGAKPAALTSGNYTLSAWIRTTESAADVIGNGTSTGHFLLMIFEGVVRGHQWTAQGATVLDGKSRVDDGRWHHVAQVVDGDTLSVVVDGRLDGSMKIAGTKIATTAAVTIGARGGEASQFKGSLDEVCVFDRALSIEQMKTAFPAERAPKIEVLSQPHEEYYLAVRKLKRQILFKHPAIDFTQILYIDQPLPHGHESDHEAKHRNGRMATQGGRLMVLDGLNPGGKLRQLGPTEPAAYWRPDLSFDTKKVLFCMKPATDQSFHLYEINFDGTGLRQLTKSLYDDLDPIYLPDGHIMFVSSRSNTYIRCMPETYSYVLARCDGDGRNIYLISRNSESDWLPSLLNDGRVIFSRWEYTDKPLWRNQKLWTINQDGTGEAHFWGGQSFYPDHTAMPRPIPNSQRVMFAAVGHHGWFNGTIGIVDQNKGNNYPHGITRVSWDLPWPEVNKGPADVPESPVYHTSGQNASYQTPWPISEDVFLVSIQTGGVPPYGRNGPSYTPRGRMNLYLMDVHGNRELILHAKNHIMHAMPVRPRSFPQQSDRVTWPGIGKDRTPTRTGVLYSRDVCQGLPQVPREMVKFLRIIQQDPKTYSTGLPRVGFTQGPVISAVQVDSVKRILGTVPIAADGSVAFEVPPGKAVYFQLLDEKGRALQTMRSFTGVMPGEIRGCTGCHEQQSTTALPANNSAAYRFNVTPITPPPWGTNTTVGFERFVQPVLNKHCGKCHQGEGEGKKKLDLTSRPGVRDGFKHDKLEPYLTLALGRKDMGIIPVEAGGANSQFYATIPPMTTLSYKSLLIDIAVNGKHHDVKIDGTELQQLIAWVDCVGPFRGEEEVREIPDCRPDKSYPIPLLTKTAPIIDRFNVSQDFIPERDGVKK